MHRATLRRGVLLTVVFALGDTFDVREFHTPVLTTVSLPLLALDAKIDRWIASQQS